MDAMHALANKNALVIGLGVSGQAAARLLQARGAKVTALDSADTPALRSQASEFEALGMEVLLGTSSLAGRLFDLAVVSPGVPPTLPLVQEIRRRNIPLIGELELGFQQSLCLNVAVTGTNGKTTTTELIECLLTQGHRK